MLGEEGAAELVDRLANDRSPEVRAASAQALGSLTATRAGTSALVAALDDPDPQVVLAALDSLQWIDDPSVLPDVQKVLDHSDPEVREAAAETVSWLD
jgi:HEAT repeat protein